MFTEETDEGIGVRWVGVVAKKSMQVLKEREAKNATERLRWNGLRQMRREGERGGGEHSRGLEERV